MTALLINNVDAATFGFILTEAPSWIDLPPRTTPSQPVLGKQGSIVTAAPIEAPRRLVLRGIVSSSSAAQTRTNIDNLKVALLAALVQLTFQDSSTRYITVGLDNFAVQWAGPALIERRLRVEMQFTAYDPYFYDIATTTVNFNGSGIAGTLVLGTGTTRPIVTLTGAGTGPINLYSQDGATTRGLLTINTTTVGGDTLVVDMDARTVKKNGVSILNLISSGDFWTVDPIVSFGLNPYVQVVPIMTGNVAYKKAWR